jgi:hypothetical protein
MYWWYRIFKDLQELKELCIQREKYVDELEEENKKLREDVEYRRTCYEDLRRIEWYDKIKLEDYLKD